MFPAPSYVSDATAGMLVVVILFVYPARSKNLDKVNMDEIDKCGDGDV
jgi:uncharacterized membrane protein